MVDLQTDQTNHVAKATAAELLAGLGPAAPQARSVQFPTGFQPLDDVLNGGFRAQDLVLLGGRPGIGKTVAALQWARWMAMQGHTAIFTTVYKDSHNVGTVKGIRFIRPDVTVVHVEWNLEVRTGDKAEKGRAMCSMVMTKEGGKWSIAAFHNTPIQSVAER